MKILHMKQWILEIANQISKTIILIGIIVKTMFSFLLSLFNY